MDGRISGCVLCWDGHLIGGVMVLDGCIRHLRGIHLQQVERYSVRGRLSSGEVTATCLSRKPEVSAAFCFKAAERSVPSQPYRLRAFKDNSCALVKQMQSVGFLSDMVQSYRNGHKIKGMTTAFQFAVC